MTLKRALISFGIGLLGVFVALAGWHLYEDHQSLHALVNMVVQQQAAALKAQGEKK